jgi:CheY-like chemotaxis protein
MAVKVLIVDDSKLARMSVAKALAAVRSDWKRLEAANADEAIALVKSEAVDIALLDFNMPGRDGLALAAEIRQIEPEMPVALVSANYQHEIVERAKELGATFLTKPLTEQQLREFLDLAAARLPAR